MVADDVLALKQSSEQGRKGERCNYLLRGIIQPNTHTLNRGGEEGGGRDSDDDEQWKDAKTAQSIEESIGT